LLRRISDDPVAVYDFLEVVLCATAVICLASQLNGTVQCSVPGSAFESRAWFQFLRVKRLGGDVELLRLWGREKGLPPRKCQPSVTSLMHCPAQH
jgi:hypothetical protein